MIKVLIILNSIQHYRIPIYNLLAEKVDLTIAHSDHPRKGSKPNYHFNDVFIESYNVGGLIIHSKTLFKLVKGFDVVIALSNLRCLSLLQLGLKKNRKYKLIYWGIGVSASTGNEKRYDADRKYDFLRKYFYSRADATIFYSEYPRNKYLKMGVQYSKMFIANNTVEVYYDESSPTNKDQLVFLGSLYKSKGINHLLEGYKKAHKENQGIPVLHIIGGGEEIDNIKEFIRVSNLEGKIIIHGPIYDKIIIHDFLRSSLAMISPNQAGLSVLTSFGSGVPFITSKDAITGGERFNIVNGKTGIIYENQDDICDIILDIYENKEKYVIMGRNARQFYLENRLPEMMRDGILEAIFYVNKNS